MWIIKQLLTSMIQSFRFSRKLIFALLTLCLVALVTARINAQNTINQHVASLTAGNVVNKLAWNSTGQNLAVAYSNGLTIYSDTLQILTQIHNGSYIWSVSWQPGGNKLAVTYNSTVEIWNFSPTNNTLTLERTLAHSTLQPIFVSWSNDTNHLVTIAKEIDASGGTTFIGLGTIFVWNPNNGMLKKTISQKYIINVSYSTANLLQWDPNGVLQFSGVGNKGSRNNGILTSQSELSAYTVDFASGSQNKTIPLKGNYALSVAKQPNNGDLLAVGGEIGISLYSYTSGQYQFSSSISIDTQSLAWSPDGKYIAADGGILDVETKQILGYFQLSNPARSVDWSSTGKIAFGSTSGEINVDDSTLLVSQPTSTPTPTPTPTATPSGSGQSSTNQVNASTDDVNEDGTTYTANAITDWFGNGASATGTYLGLRFNNVTVPCGATIISAKLHVYSSQSQCITVNAQFAAEASDNPATFSSTSKPSQRTLTTARVNHSSNVSWNAATW